MNRSTLLSTLSIALLLSVKSPATAQETATPPVGVCKITIKGNSDTLVSLPLAEKLLFTGTVGSSASAGSGLQTITVSGASPAWTANQLNDYYYVRVLSGAREGMYYTIKSNTANSVTVDTAGDDLSTLAAGDGIKVYKHWTLDSLLPHNDATRNPLTVSATTSPITRKSQVFLYTGSTQQTNPTPTAICFFTNNGWFFASPIADANNTIIPPDSYFVVRQPLTAADTQLEVIGSVVTEKIATPLATNQAGSQDNVIGLMRPIDTPLSQLGLENGFVESATLSPITRRDQLFVYDNTVAEANKAPKFIYFRQGGNWYSAAAGNPLANDVVLKSGDGFQIRKYRSSTGFDDIWKNSPGY